MAVPEVPEVGRVLDPAVGVEGAEGGFAGEGRSWEPRVRVGVRVRVRVRVRG